MERPHEANRIMGQLYHLLRSGMKEHNLPDIELLLLRAYNLYQNSHNPAPVSPVLPFTYDFSYGDVHFLVIDARSQRSEHGRLRKKDILGVAQ